MKYAPKKVFILENGLYKEITYSELKQLEQEDKSYMDKFFLPLHGMLMEVTEETYKEYYRDKRRQKYIDERSRLNGDVSYNALDTDETLGEDVLRIQNGRGGRGYKQNDCGGTSESLSFAFARRT